MSRVHRSPAHRLDRFSMLKRSSAGSLDMIHSGPIGRVLAKRASSSSLGSDTSSDVQRMQVALWREMSSLEKARAVGDVSSGVRELSLLGIRERHPEASERECRLRYALLTLGRSLALEAYPDLGSIGGRQAGG